MSRRTIENCSVIKKAVKEEIGEPGHEELNGKTYCQGYENGNSGDPYCDCMDCHLLISNQDM